MCRQRGGPSQQRRLKLGHDAIVCSRSIRSPGHVSSALYAVREVRKLWAQVTAAVALGGKRQEGKKRERERGEPTEQKHKTPDNITHPFPDYPFEKLFCRWAMEEGPGEEEPVRGDCYPAAPEVFLHTRIEG